MTRSLATLTDLVAAVRQAVDVRTGWTGTAELVADQLREHLPGPGILTPDQRLGRPDRVAGHLLHADPDGAFSVLGLVWRPGQTTRIHDHITWCVVGVLSGVEHTDISRVGCSARRYYN
jgi:3-mercaptopropionate dioxygenase